MAEDISNGEKVPIKLVVEIRQGEEVLGSETVDVSDEFFVLREGPYQLTHHLRTLSEKAVKQAFNKKKNA